MILLQSQNINIVLSSFNNREIAIIFWLAIVVIILLFIPSIRKSASSIIKSIFSLSKFFIGMFLYIACIILILSKIGYWDISFLKDTIIWILGSGVILIFKVSSNNDGYTYINQAVFENVKFITVLEFLINTFTFNLITWLILIPVIFSITAMYAVSTTKDEFKSITKVLQFMLSFFFVIILIFSLYGIVLHLAMEINIEILKDFLLPLILTILYIPYVYGVALYTVYENLFFKVNMCLGNKPDLAEFVKYHFKINFRLNLKAIQEFNAQYGTQLMTIKDKSDLKKMLKDFFNKINL